MNWKEHHQKNAKRCFIAGTALFLGGAGFGLSGWLLERPDSLQEHLLIVAEIWLLSMTMIGAGWAQKRKANRQQPPRSAETDAEGESLIFPDREMMIKQLSGLQSVYRYFSVDGDALLEFRETSSRLLIAFGLVFNGLHTFLKRTYTLSDKQGIPRLYFKQKAGLNAPIDVFLPNGEKICSYKQGLLKARIEIRDGSDALIGLVIKDDLLGTSFTIIDHQELKLIQFYNGGLPSRNFDYFSSSDDLIKIAPNLASQERLYMQVIALPAFIKMMFRK